MIAARASATRGCSARFAIRIVVATETVPLLASTTVAYLVNGAGKGFVFRNPNAPA